ncbi:cytochrome P450 7B1 isoform X2 [Hyperolius riggenbachi]|uniref:cytochrome P450 7B1 isoform X2 n=1 Tax=Hyperolius riggenbachi TaxID=752182 RepID=UPI0035A39F21
MTDYLQLLLITVVLLLVSSVLATRRRRRDGEPPLDIGWIPFIGLAIEFRKDPLKFLKSRKERYGDVFTVCIAGRYITFIMDPTQYQYVIRHGKKLDFHEFSNEMASRTFHYPRLSEAKFPQLRDGMSKIYKLMQGKPLDTLTDSMMMNLQHVFKWKFSQATDWRAEKMYQLCCSIMFEASFMTLYGRDPVADGRKVISEMREKFTKFDAKFPYLVINIPIVLLGDTKTIREELIAFFMPHKMDARRDLAEVIQARKDILEHYDVLRDNDKAGSAISESLRLCSASMNIRLVQEDFQLELEDDQTVNLRKGDFVALYPPTLHRDPEVFEDPEKYKFDRFVEDGKEKTTFYKKGKKLKTFLMPFGSGSSKCPGRFFAINEIKHFLAVLLMYLDMEIAEDKIVHEDNSRAGLGILLPDSDIMFHFRHRKLDFS